MSQGDWRTMVPSYRLKYRELEAVRTKPFQTSKKIKLEIKDYRVASVACENQTTLLDTPKMKYVQLLNLNPAQAHLPTLLLQRCAINQQNQRTGARVWSRWCLLA